MVVTVTYEGVPIVRGGAGKALAGGEIFVRCDTPMPVWTPVVIELDGGKPQSAQVTRIEEGPTPQTGSQPPSQHRLASQEPGMYLCIGDITLVEGAPSQPSQNIQKASEISMAQKLVAAPVSPSAPAVTSKSPKSKRKRRR